jgi:hypothetical protein
MVHLPSALHQRLKEVAVWSGQGRALACFAASKIFMTPVQPPFLKQRAFFKATESPNLQTILGHHLENQNTKRKKPKHVLRLFRS